MWCRIICTISVWDVPFSAGRGAVDREPAHRHLYLYERNNHKTNSIARGTASCEYNNIMCNHNHNNNNIELEA